MVPRQQQQSGLCRTLTSACQVPDDQHHPQQTARFLPASRTLYAAARFSVHHYTFHHLGTSPLWDPSALVPRLLQLSSTSINSLTIDLRAPLLESVGTTTLLVSVIIPSRLKSPVYRDSYIQ